MGTSAASARIIRFGVFEVDLNGAELRKQGLRIKLPEQPFQILAMLLEKPGEIVTREELRNRLWQTDTFVDFDHGVNNAVMRLREVLGDSSDNPRFIETLPRRGYRFIAHIDEFSWPSPSVVPQETESASPPQATEAAVLPPVHRQEGRRRQRLIAATLALVALMAAGFGWRYVATRRTSGTSIKQSTSVVVLPLDNLSGDREQDYFADGMTDDLIANLAKIRSLRVISRSTAMAYKHTRKPLSEIANELHVDAVVEGTILRVDNRVRITAELVQVSTDRHLWADTYESEIGDVLALQNRVSSAIVSEIRVNLSSQDRERLARNPAVAPEAYENYLKGRYYWNKRTDENLNRAIAYFGQATRQDSHYALAYAGLADCYAIVGAAIFGTMSVGEAAPRAREAAQHALEIDPTSAEAETSLATLKFNYDWDWSGAEEGFQRAIQLNPSYATAYQRYSLFLMAMGRFKDGFNQINKARELDPLSISINFSLGWRLYLARQYDRAITQLRNTLEMDPSYELPHLVLGQAYEEKGTFDLAIPELQKAVELSHGTPLMIAALAHGFARSGNRAEAQRLLTQLELAAKHDYVSPYYFAIVCLGLGKNEQALAFLDKAFADRSNGLVFMGVEPELDPIRFDPRFIALQKRLNLPTQAGWG
jgi:TolB-like protein/DNA-binding winged helix-turn-helix (wHTH) protein/Flp pilus assembly protein TadD